MSFYVPGRCGVAYKNGKLYEFTTNRVTVYKGYPDPRAWQKDRDGGWKHCRPKTLRIDQADGPLIEEKPDSSKFRSRQMRSIETVMMELIDNLLKGAPFSDAEYARNYRLWCYQSYFNTFPPEIVNHIKTHYLQRHFHLLCFFSRSPYGFELSQNNPALAFALANHWAFHKPAVKSPMRAMKNWAKRKQGDIAEWLGFAPEKKKAAARILRNISVPEAINPVNLYRMRCALQDPQVMKMFSHLPSKRINTGAVSVVYHPRRRGCITPNLLNEISMNTDDDEKPVSTLLINDTFRMADMLNLDIERMRFNSLRRIINIHDELAYSLNRNELSEKLENLQFVAPPYNGISGTIEPLDNVHKLHEAAGHFNNCSLSYAGYMTRDKRKYLYRLTSPETAMFSISYSMHSHKWYLEEITGVRNRKVQPGTRIFVEKWLETVQSVESEQPLHKYFCDPEEEKAEVFVRQMVEQMDLFEETIELEQEVPF